MAQSDYLTLKLTPEDLKQRRFDSAEELMALLTTDDDSISKYQGKLFFDLGQVVQTTENPAEEEDLRNWFIELDTRYPYLAYFISRDSDAMQLPLYASMFVPSYLEGESLGFDRQKMERFAAEKIQVINQFCTTHNIDPRSSIRSFCERLHLDVIEELVEEENSYPFEPEKITSPFLLEFFDSGFYFHTIDASDEAVLFALVDDPVAAYYAESKLVAELFSSETYPVIALELTIFDLPENPLKMTFVYNVETERHRQELYAYSEMPYLTANILFKKNDELQYAFTRAVELDDELRGHIRGLVLEASNLLRAIPKDRRDFSEAVRELFELRTDEDSKTEQESEDSDKDSEETKTKESETAEQAEEEEETSSENDIENQGENDSVEDSPQQTEMSLESPAKGKADKPEAIADQAEIIEEFDASPEEDHGMDKETENEAAQKIRSPYESNIPSSVLPESIQKITKALSKPIRRPAKSVTEQLSPKPAPTKKVKARDEDQLERLSRRLLIMQNNLERTERENMRISSELNLAREEIERLQRENLALESRWWKFWK